MTTAPHLFDQAKDKALALAGGPARFQVIILLAAVLGLDTADKGTVGGIGNQLKDQFAIGNTSFGLLLAVVSFATAIATLPRGGLWIASAGKTFSSS